MNISTMNTQYARICFFALLILGAGATFTCAAPPFPIPALYAQQQTTIRIRIYSHVEPIKMPLLQESKGPKCVRLELLAGANIASPTAIDLLLRNGQRLRANLQKGCSTEDFYSGFYLSHSADGQICIKRDTFHSRIGTNCTITKFHNLNIKK